MEAWPSWKGSALLARRRRSRPQVRVLLPPFFRCDVVQRRTPGCYPEDAGSSPAVAAHAPVVQRSRMPVSHTGDAGSNPARVPFFLRSRTRLAMRPGCLPGEAGSIPVESVISPSLSGRAPRSYRGPRGFDSSRRDCVARLVASPRAVNPWSRVRFPGDASHHDDGPAGQAPL